MIEAIATTEFQERFAELPTATRRKAERRLDIFRENPFHSSLATEKLHPKAREVWSFRIDRDYRIIFRFRDARTVYLLTVGHHNWIYRYLG